MPEEQAAATERTVSQLARVTGKMPDRIRRDCRRGNIRARRPGSEWLFDPDQWEAAVAYYRRPQLHDAASGHVEALAKAAGDGYEVLYEEDRD